MGPTSRQHPAARSVSRVEQKDVPSWHGDVSAVCRPHVFGTHTRQMTHLVGIHRMSRMPCGGAGFTIQGVGPTAAPDWRPRPRAQVVQHAGPSERVRQMQCVDPAQHRPLVRPHWGRRVIRGRARQLQDLALSNTRQGGSVHPRVARSHPASVSARW